jgi:hypothetical protein
VLPQTIDVDNSRREALVAAMTAMQPIAALLLEAGVSYADMLRLVRRAYVDEAAARQRAAGSRPTISRIAASTGLSRPDVSEALSAPPIPNNATSPLERVTVFLRDGEVIQTSSSRTGHLNPFLI